MSRLSRPPDRGAAARKRTLLARLNDPTDVAVAVAVSALLCVAEIALCSVIVWRVPYTEIDWKAYMSEARGVSFWEWDVMSEGRRV
jgi:alpha-1,3-mannosyltransferase